MTTPDPPAGARLSGKYLTFHLRKEEYGIEILKVREIIGMQKITQVPRTPEFVKGVINLRGRIIPVIDLRRKFGLPDAACTKETCIIVVSMSEILVGIIVDSVSEVVDIEEEDVGGAPAFGEEMPVEFIRGMGKIRERVAILLNIEAVLSLGEKNALEAASAV